MKYGICIDPAAERSLSLSVSEVVKHLLKDNAEKCNQCDTECALTLPCKSARSLSPFGKLLPHQSGRKCVSVAAALRAEQGP